MSGADGRGLMVTRHVAPVLAFGVADAQRASPQRALGRRAACLATGTRGSIGLLPGFAQALQGVSAPRRRFMPPGTELGRLDPDRDRPALANCSSGKGSTRSWNPSSIS